MWKQNYTYNIHNFFPLKILSFFSFTWKLSFFIINMCLKAYLRRRKKLHSHTLKENIIQNKSIIFSTQKVYFGINSQVGAKWKSSWLWSVNFSNKFGNGAKYMEGEHWQCFFCWQYKLQKIVVLLSGCTD